MANISKELFIIDACNGMVKTKAGTYITLTASSGQVALSGTPLEIKGGQSAYALLSVLTEQQVNVTLTDAQFNGDMMLLYGAKETVGKQDRAVFTDKHEIPSDGEVELQHTVKEGTLDVPGFTLVTSTPTEGQYTVSSALGKTTLTFNASDANKIIQPTYRVSEDGIAYDFLNDGTPAKGAVTLQFPAYGEIDGVSGEIGMVQIDIYSGSIVPTATIGGSYKTASTFSVEIKAEDAKRADKKVWNITLFDKEGNVVQP